MEFYELSPEVAGEIGPQSQVNYEVHPPLVTELQYLFHGWLGDDLLEAFPCYIMTVRLKNELLRSSLTGYMFKAVEVTVSDQFKELYPAREIGKFAWFLPIGQAGVDDFGISETYQLVVSEEALRILKQFQIKHCDVVKIE